MSQAASTPQERYALLVETFLGKPEVSQEGKGFGADSLKVKGKIFAMLVRDRLVVKLPKPRVDALIAVGKGERFDPRHDGRLLKEWLVIESGYEEEWSSLAEEAREFVIQKPGSSTNGSRSVHKR